MKGVPLLLLHGWGMHAGIWADVQRQWLVSDVFVPDLPGYGGTSPLAGGLNELVQQMLRYVPDRFDVCGWSLGGLLAQRMALLAPDRIRRVVLVGATPCFVTRENWNCGIEKSVLMAFGDDLAQAYEPTLKRFLALQVRGEQAARDNLARLREQLFARGKPDVAVLQQGLQILLDTDLRAEIPMMRQPLLLVQGSQDQLTSPCAAEWLATEVAGAQLIRISGAAHAPFLSHTTAFVAALQDFLAVSADDSVACMSGVG